MLSTGDKKAEIRSAILAMRDALAVPLRIEKSMHAAELASAAIEFQPGTVISAFFPIRSEIDPRPLMDALRQRGADLCLPIVIDKTTIVFRRLERGAELIDTGFGTRGPGPEAKVLDPSILLMPLSVFDHRGGRIGYGAGHYDRAIAKLIAKGIAPRLIGMAFDCQEFDAVPQEKHDVALDALVSESGYRVFDKQPNG